VERVAYSVLVVGLVDFAFSQTWGYYSIISDEKQLERQTYLPPRREVTKGAKEGKKFKRQPRISRIFSNVSEFRVAMILSA